MQLVNRVDILDLLKQLPTAMFDLILVEILQIDITLYTNEKDMKDLKDKIMDYLGFMWIDGKLSPRPELDLVARDHVQYYIDLYYHKSPSQDAVLDNPEKVNV